MKIKEALKKLEEKGFKIREDKAIFELEDGALEFYVDNEKETIKTLLRDSSTFMSEDLKDRSMEGIMYELAGIDEEDKNND